VTRVIRFNAFDMNCVAHQSPGLWRHPEDQSWRYKDLGYWTELAKLLERGRFDGLFIADVLGTDDVYGASDEAAIRQAAQIPVNDPLLLVSAMASVTDNLGFGITTGTGFEHPYPFARRMSTRWSPAKPESRRTRSTPSTCPTEILRARWCSCPAGWCRSGTLWPRRADRQRRLERDPVGCRGIPVCRPRRPGVGGARHR
jgi:hypothetical protein